MKNRGTSLIEVLVSISIIMLLSPIMINTFITLNHRYIEHYNYSIYRDSVEGFLINLDNLLSSNFVQSIETNNNILSIKIKVAHESNSFNTKRIEFEDGNLYLRTYIGSNHPVKEGSNILLKNVKDFKLYKKNNLIYLYIETKAGEVFIRCI